MDSLSHAIVGIAVAGLSGHAVSATDPIYLAAFIGSQAPDFDIIAHAKSKVCYLKQHRSFSHSLPGILLWPALTAFGFFLFFTQEPHLLLQILFWCFLGCLSHVALDCLNTHGVAFFWPFAKKRFSLNLLNVIDPCLLIITLFVFMLKLPAVVMSAAIFAIFCCYAGFRYFLRRQATRQLAGFFGDTAEIFALPSLRRIFFWDFIIKTSRFIYIGQIGALSPVLSIRAKLPNEKISALIKIAQKTNIGQFFADFTPFSYFKEETNSCDDIKIVRVYDLRYCFEWGFAYNAAIIFGSDSLPCASYIYAYGKKITLNFSDLTSHIT